MQKKHVTCINRWVQLVTASATYYGPIDHNILKIIIYELVEP